MTPLQEPMSAARVPATLDPKIGEQSDTNDRTGVGQAERMTPIQEVRLSTDFDLMFSATLMMATGMQWRKRAGILRGERSWRLDNYSR